MITSKDMKFIKINKQEDLPTDIEIKGRLSFEIEFPLIQKSGATQIEELVLPNGDIIVSNKFFQKVDSTVPLNVEASILYSIQTGSKEKQIRGHCFLIKKNIKY